MDEYPIYRICPVVYIECGCGYKGLAVERCKNCQTIIDAHTIYPDGRIGPNELKTEDSSNG